MRNKFLELITDEKYFLKIFIKPQERGCCRRKNQIGSADDQIAPYPIGDIKKRNKMSIEPIDYEHEQPIQITPQILKNSEDIEKLIIESLEADYLIVLTEEQGDNKLALIESQLDDLELQKDIHYFVFKEKKKDLMSSLNPDDEPVFEVFIAIKFTNAQIDKVADKLKVYGDLDCSNIRAQFNMHMKDDFEVFDSRQRYTCITHCLEE